MKNLVSKYVQKLTPYQSARSLGVQGSLFLDANEYATTQTHADFRRYPDPQPMDLLEPLAQFYQVAVDNMMVVRGIDEVIDLMIRAFCEPEKDHIIITSPTYGMYKVCADINGVACRDVPLLKKNNFALDVQSILEQRNDQTKIIFICSPNNPTGNVFSKQDIQTIVQACQGKTLVVLDEAYVEFSDQASWTAMIDQCDTLVCMRTLSKVFGMASLRVGSLIANPSLVAQVQKIRAPYPIPGPVAAMVVDFFNKTNVPQFIAQRKQMIATQREKMSTYLSDQPWVYKVFSSDANFVLAEVENAQKVYDYLLSQEIVIRNRSTDTNISSSVRFTIGNEQENEILIRALSGFGGGDQ